MARKDKFYNNLPSFDSQRDAETDLDAVLAEEGTEEEMVILDERIREKEGQRKEELAREVSTPETHRITVADALSAAPVVERTSDRDAARLLIVTKDTFAMAPESLSQKRITELAEIFAEVHVIVLTEGGDDGGTAVRIATNAWVYPTGSSVWWRLPLDGYALANEQLVFAQGFRADIILAEDPFESGVVAALLGRKHNRPFQVHILEDYWSGRFKDEEAHNGLRLFAARRVLNRASCVRTKTEFLKNRVAEEFSDLAPYTEVLPMYHNLAAWRDAEPAFDLHEKYPQFKFVFLHITRMSELSHTDRVITGALRILRQYPTVGLVIVGDGPARRALEKQVATFEIQSQVAFLDDSTDHLSCMKTANLLIHLSEDSEEEKVVLQAAAVGLPMVLGIEGLAGELFIDGESAFLCPNDSPPCVAEKLTAFLNRNDLRTKFSRGAEEIVFERIEQDYGAYMEAYRSSVERCLIPES